jgi:isoleucyl-tRNA synthetase
MNATMTDSSPSRDYRETLFLPKTDFPMRAGLPKKEPEFIKRWQEQKLYETLRQQSKGRNRFVLHDGPPYANGHLHIGHALNKTLKDVIVRIKQMSGWDSNYVPGWDCHGLPIEWKIEEQYRAKGKDKDDVPVVEFRKECREFASQWVGVQSREFQRLGVIGDWKTPYLTMDFAAEADIARELMKFAKTGQLYRGSKPIMWSVVERTALAEAEIEYHEVQSDTIWVKFAINDSKGDLAGACVVIWTTTPWTIPGNRAICFSDRVSYGLYEVTAAENDFGPQPGEKLVFADALAEESFAKAKLEFKRQRDVNTTAFTTMTCSHPLKGFGGGYEFDVPLLAGDHVTDDAGTGFVHTAPSHGREDFDAWMSNANEIEARGIRSDIPFTVDDAGYFTEDAPGFGPDREGGAARVLDDKGKTGDANQSVISALIGANALFARGRIKHDYPHSWRSKKPIIFRNTPQWFVYMDRDIADGKGGTLRERSLKAISETRFVPEAGQARLRGMIEGRPDWVLSRQRAWGVPICVFVDADGSILKDDAVNERIAKAFEVEGADAWFADGAKDRFLAGVEGAKQGKWEMVTDILDVWFDSGSTHAFCMERRDDLRVKRHFDGGHDKVMYLEGTDQHRGWFHSSLLESCGTRGHAPYDEVVTHGFTMAEDGRKMSKSLNNQMFPQDIIKQFGADILRLWVVSCDYMDDQRIGPEIIKSNVDAYRKMRNTMRYLLGALTAYDESKRVDVADMPELERYILHKLHEVGQVVQKAYDNYDFKRAVSALVNFMNVDLSAFYFDIRKDALYCDRLNSNRRQSCLTVMDELFKTITTWLAPMLCFTAEEVWLSRFGDDAESVHLQPFGKTRESWQDQALGDKWTKIRKVRSAVTGALEEQRRDKNIRSSLESAPAVFVENSDLLDAMKGIDLAEIFITSDASLHNGTAPDGAFMLNGVGVVHQMAEGKKCARSWIISTDVGSDPDYPDITPRDAQAVREWDAAR